MADIDQNSGQGIRLLAESDIAQMLFRFFRHLDAREYEALTQLMSAECVWHRQGKVLRGRPMVLEALRERPPGTTTRHIVTNVTVDFASGSDCVVTYYMTAFRHDAAEPPRGPAPMGLPVSVSIGTAGLHRYAEGWLVKEMASAATFAR